MQQNEITIPYPYIEAAVGVTGLVASLITRNGLPAMGALTMFHAGRMRMRERQREIQETKIPRTINIEGEMSLHGQTRQMTIGWNLKLDNRESPTPSVG